MNKIEDFGVHANQYYPLDVSFFKSSLDSHMLDMLWNKCAPLYLLIIEFMNHRIRVKHVEEL